MTKKEIKREKKFKKLLKRSKRHLKKHLRLGAKITKLTAEKRGISVEDYKTIKEMMSNPFRFVPGLSEVLGFSGTLQADTVLDADVLTAETKDGE